MRDLTTDCNYVLPCPHAAAAAQACAAVLGCSSVDYTSEVIKDILLSGIYDLDVRCEVLGTAGIEDRTINDLVCIVEAKEAAQDAAGGGRPAATAAAAPSYKKAAKQETAKRPQPARPRGGPPNGTRPKKARCRCGNEFTDYAVRPDGSFNQSPYESCRDCFLRNKRASRENRGGRSSVAAAASGGQAFEPAFELAFEPAFEPPAARPLAKQGYPPPRWPTTAHGYALTTPTTPAWRYSCPSPHREDAWN